MKHVRIFEEFILEKELNDGLVSTVIDSGEITILHPGTPWRWDEVAEWIGAAKKSGRQWKVSFVLPEVAEFEMEAGKYVEINKISNFPLGPNQCRMPMDRGQGTNFDDSVMKNWYKNQKLITYAFAILVNHCSKAAYAPRVKTDLKVDYGPRGYTSLEKFGFVSGEHVFDPGARADDLYVWIQYSPRLILARGTFRFSPELEKIEKEYEDKFLAKKITVKLEIQ
jgi:hypothetical protein